VPGQSRAGAGPLVLAGEVEAPVFPEVAVADHGAQPRGLLFRPGQILRQLLDPGAQPGFRGWIASYVFAFCDLEPARRIS
jgi:hypothetical protein